MIQGRAEQNVFWQTALNAGLIRRENIMAITQALGMIET